MNEEEREVKMDFYKWETMPENLKKIAIARGYNFDAKDNVVAVKTSMTEREIRLKEFTKKIAKDMLEELKKMYRSYKIELMDIDETFDPDSPIFQINIKYKTGLGVGSHVLREILNKEFTYCYVYLIAPDEKFITLHFGMSKAYL